ncbi:MAG: twin-arginine translocation signal domain-containing protein, partial [Chloroflexota bacterium]|nr:twin-arginine translocation signal domain-containing protein [Chloroflexota bacterium]
MAPSNGRSLALVLPLSRRRVLKGATGAAAALCATGVAGKGYRRTLAQDDIRAELLSSADAVRAG